MAGAPDGRARAEERPAGAGAAAATGARDACPICVEGAGSERGEDPLLVARLRTGYVRLASNQYFAGSTFFVACRCVREVFHLPAPDRARHLEELCEVAAAVDEAFRPQKLNIESLGNGVPHLHWWITPRYLTDARPNAPIWEDLDFLRSLWTHSARPSQEELFERRQLLVAALNRRDVLLEPPAEL